MCGIAGFSLSESSTLDRTLVAQALLAGIAERGADAVGYAHRSPGHAVSVHKQRSGASALIDSVNRLLVSTLPVCAANSPRLGNGTNEIVPN